MTETAIQGSTWRDRFGISFTVLSNQPDGARVQWSSGAESLLDAASWKFFRPTLISSPTRQSERTLDA